MIDLRRSAQRSFGEGLIEEATAGLWEPWMRQADRLLEDEPLLNTVYEALLQRHPQSRTRGRRGTPAEIVLRMLLLKHVRNWSFGELEREVRPNLVYREFTRVGSGKVPDAKALGRQALALGPEVIQQIHRRMVELAVEPSFLHSLLRAPTQAGYGVSKTLNKPTTGTYSLPVAK